MHSRMRADAHPNNRVRRAQVFMQNLGVPALILALLEEGSREVEHRTANHS